MRILILEDDLDLLQCTRSYFLERGHEVVTASTVAEAKRLLDDTLLKGAVPEKVARWIK